jgi:hypothetical protein
MERVKQLWHPDGVRRIVILRRDDGRHSFVEEALFGFTPPGEPVSDPYDVDGEEAAWVQCLKPAAGLYVTAEDAENDAVLWYEGYRTLN